jgi:hypothetical protein
MKWMRLRPLFLVTAAMLGGVAGYALRTSERSSPSSAGLAGSIHQDASFKTSQWPEARPPESQTSAGAKLSWAFLESTNYHTYIENLRSIECPEETILDIIRADVHKLFSGEAAVINGPDLAQQEEAVLEVLLPGHWGPQGPGLAIDEARLANVSPEKRGKLRSLQRTFDATEKVLNEQMLHNNFSEEDLNQLRVIRRQRKQALAQLLSQEELEDYELRTSNMAQKLQQEPGGRPLDRETILAVARLEQAFDELYGNEIESVEQSYLEERAKAQEKLDAELRTVLGDARFSELQERLGESASPGSGGIQ